ncbi:MAG: glycosyltransferase family 9 protein, partial [Bdellovibrionota bacterium]
WWVSLLVWLAGIRVRVGVRSQWHSFLFFNRSVRQKRSRADASELEYNYRLVEEGLGLGPHSLPRESLVLVPGSEALARLGLSNQGYTVVHPGMSGSALNWPTNRYEELIRKVSATEPVAITGTASDEKFLAPLRASLGKAANVHWLDGKLNGTELIEILANAKAVIAPSTGVVHLAASTGVPTLGIYSPIRVERAVRWGPQGKRVGFVEPELESLGMDTISVEDVLLKLAKL